jgi:hypothetical protein
MILTRENRRTRRKISSSVTLSITNPTWTDLGSNPGLRDEKLATDRVNSPVVLSCGEAHQRTVAARDV